MDQSRSEGKIKKGTGPLGVCPYLGVQDDPASHYMWAKPGHFCYRVRPAQAINVRHQENFCMNGRYPACVVYPASWRGALPPEVRDDTFVDLITRAARLKTSISSISASHPEPQEAEKATSRFGVDLSSLRDQADFVEEEEERIVPWWKTRWGKWVLIILLSLPIIVLSAWAVMITSRASQDFPPNPRTLEALSLTATWQAGLMLAPSSTPTPSPPPPTPTITASPTPSSTPTSTLTPTEVPPSDTPTPEPTPTATPVPYTCEDIQAYTFEIVQGPLLTPQPGYVYLPGSSGPPVRSGWIIKNTGFCTWNEILLRSASNGRLLNPFLRIDDRVVVVDYRNSQVSIPTGGQVEVLLGFTQSLAQDGIKGEWVLVINGFQLVDQPHLVLDVSVWIIDNRPTALPARPVSPERPSEEPPSTRP